VRRPPTADELDAHLHTIIARLIKMLTRRGVLLEDMGQTYLAERDADGEESRTLRPLQFMQRLAALVPRPRLYRAGPADSGLS
jgi:hypothetical protein